MNYTHGNYFTDNICEDRMLYDNSTSSYLKISSVRVSYHVFDDCLSFIPVYINHVVSLWRGDRYSKRSLAAVQDLAEHQLLLIPHQQEVHCPHPFDNHCRLTVIQMPYILKSRYWCFPLDTPFWFWLSIQFGLVPRNNAFHIQLPPGYPCTNYCFVIRFGYQLPYNLPLNWLSSSSFAITQSGSTRASVTFLVFSSERKLRKIDIHTL